MTEELDDEIIVLGDSSDDEMEDEKKDIFEMKAPVKGTPEVITLDSDSDNEESVSNSGFQMQKNSANAFDVNHDEDDDDDFEIDPYERRTKLFVNYLPQDLSDEEFNMLFMEDGPIKECFIFRDRVTHYSYG